MTYYERVPETIMNQCSNCAVLPGAPCLGVKRSHLVRYKTALIVRELAIDRRYIDALTTSYDNSVSSPACEHCDGEKSRWVREDSLRGWTCPICDDAIDAMLAEDDEPEGASAP